MSDDTYTAFMKLLKDDPRYTIEAYQFVREALSFGQNLNVDDSLEFNEEDDASTFTPEEEEDEDWQEVPEHHLTGQTLCQAIRIYAHQQYGYLAKKVLNSWGIKSTSDFGDIVYNLIEIGMMKKSKSDRREDFDDVYDFNKALVDQFRFDIPEETQRP